MANSIPAPKQTTSDKLLNANTQKTINKMTESVPENHCRAMAKMALQVEELEKKRSQLVQEAKLSIPTVTAAAEAAQLALRAAQREAPAGTTPSTEPTA